MISKILTVLFFSLVPTLTLGQIGGGQTNVGGGSFVTTVAGVPSGTCGAASLAVNTTNGNLYSCSGGSWTLVASWW